MQHALVCRSPEAPDDFWALKQPGFENPNGLPLKAEARSLWVKEKRFEHGKTRGWHRRGPERSAV